MCDLATIIKLCLNNHPFTNQKCLPPPPPPHIGNCPSIIDIFSPLEWYAEFKWLVYENFWHRSETKLDMPELQTDFCGVSQPCLKHAICMFEKTESSSMSTSSYEGTSGILTPGTANFGI